MKRRIAAREALPDLRSLSAAFHISTLRIFLTPKRHAFSRGMSLPSTPTKTRPYKQKTRPLGALLPENPIKKIT
ncbi:hypothetical protein HW573_08115 [Agrobacterium genomosp. 3]|uniref:hypothetical protein n=1 Tax=Agrobacterium sp. TaxID=361 RepID=UPI00403783EF|nr:hypothetical protein [Agrobacterium tomkonis]